MDLSNYQQISPSLQKCCLRASANVSYQNAAKDIWVYTGMKVSEKTQQRLVHKYQFPVENCEAKIAEISVDGGKVRLRSEAKGVGCTWKDYKAICVNQTHRKAWFGENEQLVTWVNQQEMEDLVTCVGDGHPGIWNLVSGFDYPGENREILDWYHLIENLHKVGGSQKRLKQAENLLWQGDVSKTIELLKPLKQKQAHNFGNYLEKHRHRIINYSYYQAEEICAIGSGAVESTVKQIDRRLKISGAQWKKENVPQVLKHRCAYLNNSL